MQFDHCVTSHYLIAVAAFGPAGVRGTYSTGRVGSEQAMIELCSCLRKMMRLA